MAAASGPTIRLQGGPGDGQIYYLTDFLERILSAQRMGHTTPNGPGWALGYQQAAGTSWVWHGVNCHPAQPGDPRLAPYGAPEPDTAGPPD